MFIISRHLGKKTKKKKTYIYITDTHTHTCIYTMLMRMLCSFRDAKCTHRQFQGSRSTLVKANLRAIRILN